MLVKTWSEEFPHDELFMIVRKPRSTGEAHPFPANVTPLESPIWPHLLNAVLVLPIVGRYKRVDAILAQNYTPLAGKAAVLIHDLLFETNPEWFTKAELAYFAPMKYLARRAKIIFATTKTEAERIAVFTKSPEKLRVVGMGVGAELDEAHASPVDKLAPKSFILCVGRLNARKNLRIIIESAIEANVLTPEFPLVIVGEKSGKFINLGDKARNGVANGSIKLLGFVDDGTLKWLYQNAKLFIFLSLGEGFGLPPLEAKRLGAPVLASDRAIFRETLGEDGLYVNPTDSNAIAEAIKMTIRDREEAFADLAEDDRFKWPAVVSRVRAELATF